MSVWTTPTTRSLGFLVTPAVWNADIVNNLIYLKTAPVFDTAVIIGAATTAGVRLDLESGTLAVREGDDSAYAPLIASLVNLPSGGSINFASGDVTITHSTDALAFAGAANGYTFANGPVRPATNDGAALGTTATQWSDLFLASGAVINFDNGDITVTHSANTLTFAGAASGYIFNDGNVGIGGTPGSVRLDLINSLNAIRVSDVTTDATTKQGKWLQRHYTNAEEDVMVAFTLSTSTANQILIGGGSGAQNAATAISFFTAANNTTTSGTETFRISSGNIAIGPTTRLYLDGVAGTGDTYLVESSNNQVQLVVGLQRKIFAGYQTQSVGTTATTILADAEFFGSLVLVTGNEFLTSNSFCDVVMASRNVAPTVVVTYNSNGSPTARTYSRSGNALQLAMAANTYLVSTTALS